MEEEDIKILKKLVDKCENCKFATCEQCEINNTQIHAILNLLNELNIAEKMIDDMAKEILNLDIKRAENIYDKPRIWENEEGIKEYFRRSNV